jgi:uncharacterized protein
MDDPAARPEPVDDEAEHRFELTVDGHTAFLEYRQVGRRLVLIHTEVPDALEGRGIGGQLVRAALARAQRDDLTLVPRCPFARSWLERHPDVLDGLTVDWPPAGEESPS